MSTQRDSMLVAHTPGPWKLFAEADPQSPTGLIDAQWWRVESASGKWVCTFPRLVEEEQAQQFKDARLIAASPELLEACKAQHDALDSLLALCIAHVPDFMPTKSPTWPAVVAGSRAIAKALPKAEEA